MILRKQLSLRGATPRPVDVDLNLDSHIVLFHEPICARKNALGVESCLLILWGQGDIMLGGARVFRMILELQLAENIACSPIALCIGREHLNCD